MEALSDRTAAPCAFIQVDHGRFSNHTRNIYDADWRTLPARWNPELHQSSRAQRRHGNRRLGSAAHVV